MSIDSFLAMLGILMAAAWTPGPNNVMLASSGANFGLRATIPHIAGVSLGFGFMIFLLALGLGEVFETVPMFRVLLRWGGAALLLWVAWRIAWTKAPGEAGAWTKPLSFFQSAAFQWVNPKGWAMCIAVIGQFMHGDKLILVAVIISVTAILGGITSATGWATFGTYLQRWLKSPIRLKAFNLSMASIIVGGVVFVIWSGFGT